MCAALLERTVSYIFNSDPASGSQNLSADGSTFQVTLNDPIRIPAGAVNCTAGVIQASPWNSSPNIAAAFGNNLFRFTTTVAPAGTYTLTIPDRLYSVAGLNAYLSGQFANLGLPPNLIAISGNDATQKSVVTILTAGDAIDFSVATVAYVRCLALTRPSSQLRVPTSASFRTTRPRSIGSIISSSLPTS